MEQEPKSIVKESTPQQSSNIKSISDRDTKNENDDKCEKNKFNEFTSNGKEEEEEEQKEEKEKEKESMNDNGNGNGNVESLPQITMPSFKKRVHSQRMPQRERPAVTPYEGDYDKKYSSDEDNVEYEVDEPEDVTERSNSSVTFSEDVYDSDVIEEMLQNQLRKPSQISLESRDLIDVPPLKGILKESKDKSSAINKKKGSLTTATTTPTTPTTTPTEPESLLITSSKGIAEEEEEEEETKKLDVKKENEKQQISSESPTGEKIKSDVTGEENVMKILTTKPTHGIAIPQITQLSTTENDYDVATKTLRSINTQQITDYAATNNIGDVTTGKNDDVIEKVTKPLESLKDFADTVTILNVPSGHAIDNQIPKITEMKTLEISDEKSNENFSDRRQEIDDVTAIKTSGDEEMKGDKMPGDGVEMISTDEYPRLSVGDEVEEPGKDKMSAIILSLDDATEIAEKVVGDIVQEAENMMFQTKDDPKSDLTEDDIEKYQLPSAEETELSLSEKSEIDGELKSTEVMSKTDPFTNDVSNVEKLLPAENVQKSLTAISPKEPEEISAEIKTYVSETENYNFTHQPHDEFDGANESIRVENPEMQKKKILEFSSVSSKVPDMKTPPDIIEEEKFFKETVRKLDSEVFGCSSTKFENLNLIEDVGVKPDDDDVPEMNENEKIDKTGKIFRGESSKEKFFKGFERDFVQDEKSSNFYPISEVNDSLGESFAPQNIPTEKLNLLSNITTGLSKSVKSSFGDLAGYSDVSNDKKDEEELAVESDVKDVESGYKETELSEESSDLVSRELGSPESPSKPRVIFRIESEDEGMSDADTDCPSRSEVYSPTNEFGEKIKKELKASFEKEQKKLEQRLNAMKGGIFDISRESLSRTKELVDERLRKISEIKPPKELDESVPTRPEKKKKSRGEEIKIGRFHITPALIDQVATREAELAEKIKTFRKINDDGDDETRRKGEEEMEKELSEKLTEADFEEVIRELKLEGLKTDVFFLPEDKEKKDKKEKTLKRVERRFERMASETLEKEKEESDSGELLLPE